jgi:hypothetical protein
MRIARELVARAAANSLLDEKGITSYPISPDLIAVDEGLRVDEVHGFPEDVYGALIRDGNSYRVAISSGCPNEGHRRFTLAHELGHWRIDGHVEELPWTDSGIALSTGHFRRKYPVEVEADVFASELLMPRRFVEPLISRAQPGVQTVRDLADRFEVSLSAAAICTTRYMSEPVIVVLSCGKVIEWTACSGPFDGRDWYRWSRKKGEWAPPRSATWELSLSTDRVRRGEFAESDGLLCEWFPDAPETIEVVGEAVGLGPYGRVLTVLHCPDLPDLDEAEEGYDENGDRAYWRDFEH